MGLRGVGKTMILTKALEELKRDMVTLHETESSNADLRSEPFKVVYLNGNVHTDDRLALQDMVEQLKLAKLTENKRSVRDMMYYYRSFTMNIMNDEIGIRNHHVVILGIFCRKSGIFIKYLEKSPSRRHTYCHCIG
jgi:Cdc6-like AAA superfamily ATPase